MKKRSATRAMLLLCLRQMPLPLASKINRFAAAHNKSRNQNDLIVVRAAAVILAP
jgi:hypothetical protein